MNVKLRTKPSARSPLATVGPSCEIYIYGWPAKFIHLPGEEQLRATMKRLRAELGESSPPSA